MGAPELERLKAALAEDEGLRTAFLAAPNIDEAISIARQHGCEVTPDDFTAPADALSDRELEMASGGGESAGSVQSLDFWKVTFDVTQCR